MTDAYLQGFALSTPPNRREKFNRHATEAPFYLTQLRSRGRWRIGDLALNRGGFSSALGSINPRMLKSHKVILDAGCGDSPDCAYAIKQWGFERGIKLDLFDIGLDNEYATRDLADLERGKVDFFRSDICENLHAQDETVSLVTCNAMIDLVPVADRPLFYELAWRALEPGGVMSIAYIPLVNGYGWNGWDELRSLRAQGFEHINAGKKSIIIVRKPVKEPHP